MRGIFRGMDSGFFESIKAFNHVFVYSLELIVFSVELIGLVLGLRSVFFGSMKAFSHVVVFAIELSTCGSRFVSHGKCFSRNRCCSFTPRRLSSSFLVNATL